MRAELQETEPKAGQTGNQQDQTDEVGSLLAIPPSALTVERAVRLVEAGTAHERTQLFTILHTMKGNAFVQQVIAAMSPGAAGELDAKSGVTRGDAAAGTTAGYIPHPNVEIQQPSFESAGKNRYRFTDTPEEKAQKDAQNQAALDGSETADRIAALERLRSSLPKQPASVGLSAAITAELIDLQQDRDLLDANPATKGWIGNRADSESLGAFKDRTKTDCTVYVIETLKKATAAIGHPELAQEIMHEAHAGAKHNKAGQEVFSGVDIQRAMTKVLGWKSIHVDMSGSRAGLNKASDTFYNNAPVADRIKSTEDFEAKRAILEEIPFAVITVNSGGHMKLLSRGIVYECHWSSTDAGLFEASALEANFSESLFTVPPEYIARLKAITAAH